MVIIDGHNALFRLYPDPDENFLACIADMTERTALIADRLGKKIILVYDGTGGLHEHGAKTVRGRHLEVIHSGSALSADEWIRGWMSQHARTPVTIVSDDKRMLESVRRKNLSVAAPKKWYAENEKPEAPGTDKKEFGSVDYWLEEFGES